VTGVARRSIAAALLLGVVAAVPAQAAREPVLKQVDLPHNYYWRELYLPQLTTGPSAVDFLPDGESVVYSMAGSLWRQRIGSLEAVELTHAHGAYDYQPDVSSDGARVVFSRYDGSSIEIWQLDLRTGTERALTSGGQVNVEPRLSPDGSRLAWVSTVGTRHFDLRVAELRDGHLTGSRFLVAPRQSEVDRYYYSAFDHALNPSWAPDGERVYFVSNREVAWGTGDIYSVSVRDVADLRKVLSEETSWNARPEPSPDGRRILYSSYHGRQWQQLWLTTPGGAAPLPVTFGEFDRRNARWSADGRRIAYISNEHGNTSLVVQDVVGGAQTVVVPGKRRHRHPQTTLHLSIAGPGGEEVAARVSVMGSDARAHAPDDAWMHADDGFDRALQKTETHYFHCASTCTVSVPAGETTVTVRRGFAHLPWTQTVSLGEGAERSLQAKLRRNALPEEFGKYLSADLHVHMNYGGHYRSTPERLALQARAEDLDVVHNLIVNKEERFPDIAGFDVAPHPAGGKTVLLLHGQEYHTSYWGHLGLLHLQSLILPGFSSYRHTALASPYPHNGVIADLAHAQGALVGYAHPYDWEIVPANEKSLTHMLPADVAHGKVDYVEVAGFADHKSTANVWHRLLNLGFRLPAGGASDGMGNYASLHGPIGLTRTFLDTRGAREPAALRDALKQGRTFVSNGPLLGLEIAGMHPGDTLTGRSPGRTPFRIALRSPVPVDHLELIHNGSVLLSFKMPGDRRSFTANGDINLTRGGWIALRAWNDGADPAVLDLYPFATTSPIYLDLPGAPLSRTEDAGYFVAWLDRVIDAAQKRDDYNSESERARTLDYLKQARKLFLELGRASPE
jgi:TolB protein